MSQGSLATPPVMALTSVRGTRKKIKKFFVLTTKMAIKSQHISTMHTQFFFFFFSFFQDTRTEKTFCVYNLFISAMAVLDNAKKKKMDKCTDHKQRKKKFFF